MVESKRLSYIRNNQKKLRVDKYFSLQSSLDTGIAKGLTKGKKVILPSTFVGSPRYMDQLYFDGMAICSHVGFPNLFITLTCNPNWPKICRLLSPLNLKPTDRPDFVSRIFILKYEHMLSDLTKEVQINDDTLRNLTLIEIEQLLHINQRSLKDYPTMPYPQDINLTSYLQNNLIRYPIERPPAIIQFRAALHNDQKYPHSTMNNGHQITHKRCGSNTMEQPTQYESNNTEADIFLQMDSQTSKQI
ncbi:hypothetical protein JHK86_000859 [Glycine max]|nr:hypothetical protein JHK86_000859 [Glycine max]